MAAEPLQVVTQDSFGFESLATAAGVRPLASVIQLVDVQLSAGEEELSTGEAVVTFLLGVFVLLVGDQRARSYEAATAFLTGIGTFAGVDPLVGPPGVVVGEGLLAEGALVELLFGVAQPVHLQIVGDGKALPAVLASEWLLTQVKKPDVGIQVGRLGETLAAGCTEEWPLSSVSDDVGLEV